MVFYTDGGCKGNAGPYEKRKMIMVATDENGKVIVEKTQKEGSNNIAELLAIKELLWWFLENKIGIAEIRTDSKVAIGWIKGRRKPGKELNNRELVMQIREEIKKILPKDINFVWVPRELSLAGHYIEMKYKQ